MKWAMLPEDYQLFAKEVSQTYEFLTKEIKGEVQAALANFGYYDEKPLVIDGSRAHITITGVLRRTSDSYYSKMYGWGSTSYTRAIDQIREGDKNDKIKEIVLHYNTPGGSVNGIGEMLNAIRSCSKPTIAIIHGMACSAGYWLASSASKIVATSPLDELGSIGIIEAISVWESPYIKTTVLTTREKKNIGGSMVANQAELDLLYKMEALFIEDILKGRKGAGVKGLSKKIISTDFGDGSSLLARDAMAVGMIDKIDVGGEYAY